MVARSGTPARGEIWWGEAPSEKGRPYLVVTRSVAIPVLNRVLVAPVTRTIRSIAQEIAVGPDEGLMVDGVATCENLTTFPKHMLTRRLGTLHPERLHEICDAIGAVVECE